ISALRQNGLLQALVQGARQPKGAEISEELQQAREEWEAVEEMQSGLGGMLASATPPISFNEALQYFQTADLSECRVPSLFGPPRLQPQLQGERELALAMAQCECPRHRPGRGALRESCWYLGTGCREGLVLGGQGAIFGRLRGVFSLPGGLDNNERVHVRILQTIYKQLTRSRLGCPRYGRHWEELGFQGADPGTDLRGTGMLGLMQVLHFVVDAQTLPLAREIFKLSQHETQ
ncbi:PREDICTED: ELMO domain-containing protein 3, partial [Eurypyga helias]|uniref:ELMO domain-containing protein 3 n=1 Tax=Eurypyga helias TaxID=54383 RepID=UPI0005295671